MANQLETLQGDITAIAPQFDAVLSDPTLNFGAESGFAMQILQGNDFLAKIAYGNRQSFVDAVVNVAAIGISLNPAKKQAYLVPRKGRVCLDISYMGMMHLAQQTGAIQWGQALIVNKNDKFQRTGIDKAPLHEFNDFASEEERGEIVGAYVVVKTDGGDYLTHTMTIAKINNIRDRSEAWKAYQQGKSKDCPWASDPEEMCKKTVVKQAAKYWPHRDRLQQAIHYMDTEGGEGYAREPERDITPCTGEQQAHLTALLEGYGRTWQQLSAVYPKNAPYKGQPMEAVTELDMDTFIRFVERKLNDTPQQQAA
ncbi:recombinase RecT [Chromobacterium rhizoryzae]|uniref:Recombinase RecT n=1 Tax=Chromobacterium rhizoryzae TaxID=1778675 RepID=A0AAD0RPW7_9NEIS|nr:RecT family recombinase [Chromobacterium rhizoryzae]AXT46400.1 recombinase RecT [Chromobacterium rhizoryzae]